MIKDLITSSLYAASNFNTSGWESCTFVNIVLWYAWGEGVKWSAWGEVWAVLFRRPKKQSLEVNWAQWSKVDGRDILHTLKELEHKQPQLVN